VLADHDLHPDEPTVRVFRTPPAGVLRFDDDVLVTETLIDGVVLRHYAFADRWFKVNVTTNGRGWFIETGDAGYRFSFNCDIATPMARDGDSVFAVDLFVDVLVRVDATTRVVVDEDELAAAVQDGLVSKQEAAHAVRGLVELLDLIDTARFVRWLDDIVPFGPCDPPVAPPMTREPIPDRLRSGRRATW
jgi:hypothetical protein